jgi:hypothetical protein
LISNVIRPEHVGNPRRNAYFGLNRPQIFPGLHHPRLQKIGGAGVIEAANVPVLEIAKAAAHTHPGKRRTNSHRIVELIIGLESFSPGEAASILSIPFASART